MHPERVKMHPIVKLLITKANISTPGVKKKWSISTVKSILSNEKYKGDALLQKVAPSMS